MKKRRPSSELKKGVDFIGVTCVFFCHDGQGNLLMHKRSQNCRDEQGHWDPGGGSLEFGETFEQGVLREIKEEYGCQVIDLQFVTVKNILRQNNSQPTHWVALFFAAEVDPNQVSIGEPDYIDEIGWFTLDNLPSPVHTQFPATLPLVKPYLQKS